MGSRRRDLENRANYRLGSGAWVSAMLQARHSKMCCSQRNPPRGITRISVMASPQAGQIGAGALRGAGFRSSRIMAR
jgi:hypothetical protein